MLLMMCVITITMCTIIIVVVIAHQYLQNTWTRDPCYSHYGVNGSTCSIISYLGQVEHFCPPRRQPGPNTTGILPTPASGTEVLSQLSPPLHLRLPRLATSGAKEVQQRSSAFQRGSNLLSSIHRHGCEHQSGSIHCAAMRRSVSSLLALTERYRAMDAVRFMERRLQQAERTWSTAAHELAARTNGTSRARMKILVHLGLLTGDSGRWFNSGTGQGGPLGELVQWADALAALHALGHSLSITATLPDLHRLLGVPPGNGACPIEKALPFDLIFTDYLGIEQMSKSMGLSFREYACRYRVVDTFGTEPAFNHEAYATKNGFKSEWGHWNLQPQQYMTMFPHTPDNSFLGFVSEVVSEKKKVTIPKDDHMAMVYGKKDEMWKGKEQYLKVISRHMAVHGTVGGSLTSLPKFVHNHGLLSQRDIQLLLRRAKMFVGLGFPYEGPAPLEAIASGCVFLMPRFDPPHSSHSTAFFKGKPTSRLVTSQHPYAERFIGRPHVWTVDVGNLSEVEAAVIAIKSLPAVEPLLPYEFTAQGMLERVYAYLTHQVGLLAHSLVLAHLVSLNHRGSSRDMSSYHRLFVKDFCSPGPQRWPPSSAMQAVASEGGVSCQDACWARGLVCEPSFFPLVNTQDAFARLGLRCGAVERRASHLVPAFTHNGSHCLLQEETLLFSCAGAGETRVCPCRDFRRGQVALCRDCS
ncbi:alpha-1,6-mannosylglycoprotein 6-beta-N-acetylglucosaminyltransferase B-like [Petromyzon marinus]|uniref:alpha-1,6-mannosylglycoprotein 6-beta-N-acetylglucosaminyltransferase B-like n=1 Tax=Petromyzon marinus TaxID=7757 RepID=UPI003F70F3D6